MSVLNIYKLYQVKNDNSPEGELSLMYLIVTLYRRNAFVKIGKIKKELVFLPALLHSMELRVIVIT